MRSTFAEATVRLYHLGDADGSGAETLFYGPLSEACTLAAAQPEAIQAGLWLATNNDVIAWTDFCAG